MRNQEKRFRQRQMRNKTCLSEQTESKGVSTERCAGWRCGVMACFLFFFFWGSVSELNPPTELRSGLRWQRAAVKNRRDSSVILELNKKRNMGKRLLALLVFALCVSGTQQKKGKRCLSKLNNKQGDFLTYSSSCAVLLSVERMYRENWGNWSD